MVLSTKYKVKTQIKTQIYKMVLSTKYKVKTQIKTQIYKKYQVQSKNTDKNTDI